MAEHTNGFISFPLSAQVADDGSENARDTTTGFRGFLSKFFTDSASSSSLHAQQHAHDIQVVVEEEEHADEAVEQNSSPSPQELIAAQGSPKRKISNRISKLIRPSNGQGVELVDYNRSIYRQYWMPDSTGKECYECHERFTTFRRRHHCRFCGQIFCARCCSRQISGAELGYSGMLRLCNYCLEKVGIYYDPENPIIPNNSPTNVPPNEAEKVRRKSSLGQNAPPSVSASREPSIAEVPDTLNVGGEERFSIPECGPVIDPRQQTYEPYAEADEPEWVRNLNTHDEGGFLFAPPNHSACAEPLPKTDTPPATPTFEHRAEWRPPLIHGHQSASIDAQPVSLRSIFDDQTEAVLDYLFDRERISKSVWKPLLWPLAGEIVETVSVDTILRPRLINILDYVHLKKLHVSGSPSVERINGVVFSKALHHRSMLPYGENASILLLSGNISYERVVEKISSLEPILAQESDYLKNQVDRIASRKVSLLLVEHSVSTMAVEMLLNAQIGLCSNLKPIILERLARSTNADIISTLDAQLLQPRVGFCPRYYQRTVRLIGGHQKELMVLDECDPALGVSVVIRASSLHELNAAKRILRSLIQMRYSNKCELAFLELFGTTQPSQRSACEVCALNANADADAAAVEDSKFVEAMRSAKLSNTPLLRLTPPFLETQKGKECFLMNYFKKQPFHFYRDAELAEAAEIRATAERQLNDLRSEIRESQLALQRKHVHSVHRGNNLDKMDSLMPEFRVRSALLARRLNEVKKEMDAKCNVQKEELFRRALRGLPKPVARNVDVLDPYKHQQVAFVYCAEAASRRFQNLGSFCSGPSLLVWHFYTSGEDMTIGTFLKRFCFNAEYRCKECDKTMLDHFRKIIHNRANIEILTHNLTAKTDPTVLEMCPPLDEVNSFDRNALIAWKHCTKCRAQTEVKPVDLSTQNLSFGKFVDFLANAVHWLSQMRGNAECEHCAFHEHVHAFALFNTVTMFRVRPVRPLHVMFAPMICAVENRPVPWRSILTERTELKRLGAELFREVEAGASSGGPIALATVRRLLSYFDELLDDFDSTKEADADGTVPSEEPNYVRLENCLSRGRHFLNALVDEWNDKRIATTVELDPNAKLKNLCAKFGIALKVEAADEVRCLDTESFFAANMGSPPGNDAEPIPSNLSPAKPPNPTPTQLPNPFAKHLHFELPMHRGIVPVVVRDNVDAKGHSSPDLGSMIAFALASKEYGDKRRALIQQQSQPLRKRGSSSSSFGSASAQWNIAPAATAYTPPAGFLTTNLSSTKLSTTSIGVPNSTLSVPAGMDAIPGASADDPNANSIEVDFADSRAHYYVKVYFAESFHSLRDIIFTGGEEAFIRSLSRSASWDPQGGKSGASFFRTQDERFVFKQMSRLEMESFKTCAPRYFDYVHAALTEKRLTALCKIYGVFRIGYTSKTSNSQLKMDVLVMEYLFYGKNVTQMWDLKGSLRNRYASTKTEMPVLLDENFVQDLWGNQMYVHPHSKVALKQAIHNDAHFLSSQDIMDYSLLAGVCADSGEVIMGIVDYMRTYTLDKRVESLVKTALPIPHLPTVISPENYCKRFCEAIDSYFAMAPDQWTCLDSSDH